MKYQNQLYLTIALLFSTSLFALGPGQVVTSSRVGQEAALGKVWGRIPIVLILLKTQ